MLSQPKVLLIGSDEAELSVLEGILSEHVELHSVRDLLELQGNLERSYDAVFCGWSFHDATWNEVLEVLQQLNPDLPVIVFSRTGGEREWAEVLEAGAFDLMAPPYRKLPVLAVLEQAIDSYDARRRKGIASYAPAMAV